MVMDGLKENVAEGFMNCSVVDSKFLLSEVDLSE